MQIQRSTSTPSNIDRPQSSLSNRPLSRASIVPTLRPSSSLGHSRPISRLSQRPASRLSQRPASRQSHHVPAHSQISAKVSGLIHSLVTQITGITNENDPENYEIACDYANKHLELGMLGISGVVGLSWDMKRADAHFTGLVKKATIRSHDDLASAIDTTYKRLKERVERNIDLDAEVKTSRLPDHLQFLATLSLPPDQSTHELAESYLRRVYNPPKPPGPLTWAEILADEPFHGQHWEGVYGLPPGSTVEGWEVQSSGSSPSLSPWDDDMDDLSRDQGSDSLSLAGSLTSMQLGENEDPLRIEGGRDNGYAALEDVPEIYKHRQAFEDLQARQYWRPEWRIQADLDRPFSLGDHSTLAPSLNRMQKGFTLGIFGAAAHEKYIPEHYAVREVLMGLQNFENLMFTWVDSGEHPFSYQPSKSPRLMHLTPDSQHSIISAFARLATTLQHLRRFVSTVFAKATERPKSDGGDKISYILNFRRRNSRTLEAFAEAVDFEVREFDAWCSAREEDICHAQGPSTTAEQPLVVSLLGLEKSVRDEFGATFDTLKSILQDVTQKASISRRYQVHFVKSSATDSSTIPIWDLTEVQNNVPPTVITTHLLNALLYAVHEQDLMGEAIISATLMRVFSKSAEPVWSMIGVWIRDGMPIHDLSTFGAPIVPEDEGGNGQRGIDDEFFIEDNEMPLLDPDFWTEGCTLRNDGNGVSQVLPVFVEHVAQDVLSAGKAVGLLRALGGDPQPEDSGDTDASPADASVGWNRFEALIRESGSGKDEEETVMLPTSAEALSRIVHEDLHPRYLSAQQALTKVLLEDCELEYHLNVMEDCYFMRRGDVMNHFLDSLFAKMDSHQAWFDFHFLNSAFRDVVEMSYRRWIDPSLVRLSYQDSPDKATTRSVRGLDPLFVEYAVPFPLTYICGPKAVQSYSSIFVWLTQIKRARSLLENTVLRGSGFASRDTRQQAEMKAFYALRNKLSWFVNTLLDYVLTYVIQIEVQKFHERLQEVKSLDEIIQLHSEYIESIKNRCFLQQKAASLYRSILSVLDISLYFTECFATLKGESPQDSISRSRDVSVSLRVRRHRSKRLRRLRKNTIEFSRNGRDHEGDSLDPDVESSDSEQEDGDDEEYSMEPPSFIGDTTISFADEDAFTRVEKMSRELDGLIRFIRRGVENLGSKGGPESSTFGVLSFALEDWDR